MEYHQDRFADNSLLVFKDDKLLAILPANRVGDTLFSHQGLTYGGLVSHTKTKFQIVVELFKHILIHLESNDVKELIVRSLPQIYHKQPSDEMEYLLFKTKADRFRCDILSVVKPGHCEISRNRIEGVNRGKKHHLEIREVNDFSEFWNDILTPNLSDKYKTNPVHSLNEITLLKSKFPNNIRQFNVYQKEKIVAGTTIFESDQVARSQYISADSSKNSVGSHDFLHNFLLTTVFKSKPYFDFGISNENDGQQINTGLQYWKEGFGARSVVHNFYKVNTANHILLNELML